jgi:hypothetical protein
MPMSTSVCFAASLYAEGVSIDSVPPYPMRNCPSIVNSLRFAWPPKSSWLSRTRMRAPGLCWR